MSKFDSTIAANLSAVNHVNGWTSWHYRCRDAALATVFDPGYWASVANLLRDGDTITIDHPSSQSQATCRICHRHGEPVTLKVQQSF